MYPKSLFSALVIPTISLALPIFANAQIKDTVVDPPLNVVEVAPTRSLEKSSNFTVTVKDGAYGLVNKQGEPVEAFEYEEGGQIRDLFFLSKKGLQRYFNDSGQLLFETHFDSVDKSWTEHLNRPDWLVVQQDKRKGIVNRRGEVLYPFKYPHFAWVTDRLVGIINVSGQYGFTDWQAREIVPPSYRTLNAPDENGLLSASLAKDQAGLLDTAGRVVMPFEYTYCIKIYKVPDLYSLKKNERYGLADKTGKIVLPVELPAPPVELLHSSLRWEKDIAGIRIVRNTQAYGKFFSVTLAPHQRALYQLGRGLIVQGQYSTFIMLNEEGPILAIQPNNQPVLVSLEGKILIPGTYRQLIPNATRTVFYARLPDNRYQLFDAAGQLLSPDFFNALWSDGSQTLPYGFFALSDASDKFALFDPFGQRLTPHRYIDMAKAGEKENQIAREKGYLQPGRTIVARGMTEIPERQVIGWHWIDDTGAVVNE